MNKTSIVERTADRTLQSCLWLFLFLFIFRLLRTFIFKYDLSSDHCELDRIAFALSEHIGFANPFKIPTGLTSHSAPGYPLILAAIYELFGQGLAAEAVRQTLSCGVTSLQFALLPALAAAAKLSPRVGVLAALLGGLSPLRHWIETKATFEAPYTACGLVILTLLTFKLWNLNRPTAKLAWIQGFVWGAVLLFAPNLLPVLFGYLILAALYFRSSEFWLRLRYCLIFLGAAAFVLMPWTLRNYYVFHRLIFVRGNFGLELSVSNNDQALPLFDQNLFTPTYQAIHPSSSLGAAEVVQRLGESAVYHQQLESACQWIISHPGKFFRLTVERIRYFWWPPMEPHLKGVVSSLLTWCATLAGVIGLFAMFKDHRWPAATIGIIWMTYPLVYYIVEFDLRYRYPIEWTFLFTASYCIGRFWAKLREQFLTRRMPSRI